MGNIIKIGEDYYVEFIARGLKYQQKAGPDQQKAEKLLKDIEDKIARGETLTVVREIHLSAFFDQYLDHVRLDFSSLSILRFQKTIEHFSQFVKLHQTGVESLAHVTPKVVESYKSFLVRSSKDSGKKFNPKQVNLTILLLREILEYGIKTGYINDNPTLHVRLLEMPSRSLKLTERYTLARKLFGQHVPLGKDLQTVGLV